MFSLVSGIVLDPWDFELYGQFATGAVPHSWQLEVGGGHSATKYSSHYFWFWFTICICPTLEAFRGTEGS
jgi:hypothetical protein